MRRDRPRRLPGTQPVLAIVAETGHQQRVTVAVADVGGQVGATAVLVHPATHVNTRAVAIENEPHIMESQGPPWSPATSQSLG